MDLTKTINIFEPVKNSKGAEVTISNDSGRKTFHLPRPTSLIEKPPLAIESFAIDPDHYYDLMKRVESLCCESK